MAAAIVKRLATRKVVDVKDEAAAKAAIRHVVIENLASEDRIDADATPDVVHERVKQELIRFLKIEEEEEAKKE